MDGASRQRACQLLDRAHAELVGAPAASLLATPEDLSWWEGLVDDAARYPSNRDVVRRLEWLIETLVRRGQLSPTSKQLINRIKGEASVVRLAVVADKRAQTYAGWLGITLR